ncbi:MAG TPA: HEPN domain-containing protein [Actinomycetota bacterium]|nr:HEPN domain-containing protein [Actinomycetota bacterium]
MTPLDLARAFLQKGDEDEVLLSKLVTDTEVSESIFGFHVQQAAEKYIKAVLAMDASRPTRAHDLGALLEEAETLGHEIPPEIMDVQWFTPFAVQNRYPFFNPAPPIDRGGALDLVRLTRSWAVGIVSAE